MVTVPALCVIQARYHSTRLPGKMLLKLNGETLIARGHRIACDAFNRMHVVVAIPASDEAGPLGDELRRIGANIFAWSGDENDVLGRFYDCAHARRWHPDSVIVRYTPDDPFKTPEALRRVANGERLPVEMGGEAFTLAQLDTAHKYSHAKSCPGREHLTHVLPTRSTIRPPTAPNNGTPWTVDTADDYAAACEWVQRHERAKTQTPDVFPYPWDQK